MCSNQCSVSVYWQVAWTTPHPRRLFACLLFRNSFGGNFSIFWHWILIFECLNYFVPHNVWVDIKGNNLWIALLSFKIEGSFSKSDRSASVTSLWSYAMLYANISTLPSVVHCISLKTSLAFIGSILLATNLREASEEIVSSFVRIFNTCWCQVRRSTPGPALLVPIVSLPPRSILDCRKSFCFFLHTLSSTVSSSPLQNKYSNVLLP